MIKLFSYLFILILILKLFIACSSSDEVIIGNDRTICENGMAGEFPCHDYDLMSQITLNEMSATSANDSWGWTDESSGKEYAIIGLDNGTAFIDISNPINPIFLGKLATATENSSWRDIKVYRNFAFIVSEAANHGMQIFDLKKLSQVSDPPELFSADKLYTNFGNAHNIVINEDSGYAYVVGTTTFQGGPHFIQIQDPINPMAAGGYSENGYSHDAQVVMYNGPDQDYSGHEIFIGSNEDGVVIVDVTDKGNPIEITTITYTDIGYTHQGWFTDDLKFFIVGDELDELRDKINTRTLVFDFTDLDNPFLKTTYFGPTQAIDHNGYVKNNLFYLANYNAGLRIIDISNGSLNEIGFFDSHPADNNTDFNGVWNVYPYFNSGNILISDIENGMILVRKSGT